MGREFRPGFKPDLSPKQMLALGVFGGKYMTDCRREFPANWFNRAKLSKDRARASLNYFGGGQYPAGDSVADFLTDFPSVTREQAVAALRLGGTP